MEIGNSFNLRYGTVEDDMPVQYECCHGNNWEALN